MPPLVWGTIRVNRDRLRRLLHRVCLVSIGFLYVLSIPWYRDADAPLRVWLGLPDWVAVALLCYVGVAILNAAAWSLTDVSDGSPEEAGSGSRAGERR